ncbi:hypothetical protein CP993_25255, partial [Escherichia coli]
MEVALADGRKAVAKVVGTDPETDLAVVKIDLQEDRQFSLGSGVVISPQGYVLTNNHVIETADEIEVALADGRKAVAKVVGTDPETDLAVVK